MGRTIKRAYDHMNSVMELVEPSGSRVKYDRYPVGFIAKIRYDGDRSFTYTRDKLHRPIRIEEPSERHGNSHGMQWEAWKR